MPTAKDTIPPRWIGLRIVSTPARYCDLDYTFGMGLMTSGNASGDIVDQSEAAATNATVVAIHIAPGSRLPMKAVNSVLIETGRGIVGDRYHGTRHRHVTVQSREELAKAAEEHGGPIDPGLTRRNLTLSGGEIPRKPGHRWRVGEVLLEVVRDAAPCKLLEDTLGRNVKRALHRKAGVVCRVLEGAELGLGAGVEFGPLAEG